MDILNWGLILAICGGIITLVNTAEKIATARKVIAAPYTEITDKLKALEARCDRYDTYFSADKQRIESLEQAISLLMQAEFAILSHEINGNDVAKLKEAHDNMLDYLTRKGVKV